MSEYSYAEIVSKAEKIKGNVEKQYKIGEPTPWSYYIAKEVLQRSKKVTKIGINGAENSIGNDFGRQLSKSQYLDMAERFTKFVEKNKKLPNNISIVNKNMRVSDYTYMFARILAYYDDHKKIPAHVNVNSKAFIKPSEDTDIVFETFVKTFGKVTTFTDALRKIQGLGYGFYFDDFLSNLQVIKNLANGGQKPNCVDVSHMMWHIAKGLGYDVRCLHVYCPVDDITHVRLQVKHSKFTDGEWENYDPAAVIDGGGINSLWCAGNGSYIIATNPSWFMSNLNR